MGAGSGQPAARGGVELADIFRAYGESYRRNHPLPVSHLKVMQAVERCRTAALGGHLEQCDRCGFERPAYNSCLMGSNFLWGVERRKCLVRLADQVS